MGEVHIPNTGDDTDVQKCAERLQLLQRIGGFGYFEWDVPSGILSCSGEFETLYGLEGGTFPCTWEGWGSLVHPEDREEAERQIHLALETGRFDAEWRVILPDGTVRWLGGRGSLFRDSAGNPERLMGVHLDITLQKQLEKELQDSNMFLERVMQSIPCALFALDREGRFVQMNPAGYDLFGYECSDIIGQHFRLIISEETSQQLEGPLRQLLGRGERLAAWEVDITRKDGSRRTISLSAMPLMDEGNITGMVGVAPDVTDQKETERQLRESEDRHRTIFDAMNDAIFIHCARSGRIIDVNRRAQEMYGYSHEEMCSNNVAEMSGPGFTQEAALAILHRVAAGEPELFEWLARHRNGTTFWVEVNVKKVMLDGAARLLAVARDITERKRSVSVIQESEEKFRALADNIAQFAWMADSGGRIVWFNKRWYDYTGTTAEEMGNDGWWQKVQHPAYLDAVREKLSRCFDTGEPWEDTMPLCGKDGNYRWFLSRAIPIRDGAGRVTRWFGTNTDITERREIEESLRHTEERLSLAQQAAGIGIWSWEVGTEEPTFSTNYFKILGVDRQPLSFEGFLELLHPDDRQSVHDEFIRVLREGGQFESEFRVQMTDAQERWIMGRGRVYADETGTPQRMTGIISDITEHKQDEDELKRIMDDLARSNRELEQFAYVASHDLKEPLRMVTSYLRLLEKKYGERLDEKAGQYINFAVDGAERMDRLIDGLLRYSRITSRSADFVMVDTNAVFAEAVANLEQAIRESGAEVTRDGLPQVRGDEMQLMMLMQNLIGNALKYRKEGLPPWVHVTANREGREWVFAVRDNGIGIEPEHHARIFQIFQRLHTQKEYPGTGIGLASCKKIVEHHHGRIWLESIPGEGSTFFFSIPLERLGPSHSTTPAPSA